MLNFFKRKSKMCAGYDGNPHEAIIYKNIHGKKYCKSCAFQLDPPKKINPVSDKQKFRVKLRVTLLEEDKKMYMEIWEEACKENNLHEREYPRCWSCRKYLGTEPNLMFFHHVLEKRNFPELRHDKDNIRLLCIDCHSSYETNPDTRADIKYLREILLESYNRRKEAELLLNTKYIQKKYNGQII